MYLLTLDRRAKYLWCRRLLSKTRGFHNLSVYGRRIAFLWQLLVPDNRRADLSGCFWSGGRCRLSGRTWSGRGDRPTQDCRDPARHAPGAFARTGILPQLWTIVHHIQVSCTSQLVWLDSVWRAHLFLVWFWFTAGFRGECIDPPTAEQVTALGNGNKS